MTIRKYILLTLVVFTLFIVAYDFTLGHSNSDIVTVSRCPLCAAFQTTIAGISLFFILAILGIVPKSTFLFPSGVFTHATLLLAVKSPDRAPPLND